MSPLSNTKHPAKGLLKVRLDYGLATQPVHGEDEGEGSHRWVFSSYLEFKDPVSSITDSQLLMMAQNAHKEMEIDMMQYDPEDKDGQFAILPTVMTILAFDKKLSWHLLREEDRDSLTSGPKAQ
ncbi:hypothetical protein NW765_004595 [Fusarium oxysporum]|nr:hypothetical protein NW765_004595 [Fusarium oxysporum]